MKKVLSQISLILLVITLGLASVFITNTYASSAGIKCPASVKEGEEFSVSLIFPAGREITAAQANVTVTYSDGTKQTDKIVYTVDKGLNLTVDTPAKFKAKVAGNATISLTGIYMYEGDGTAIEEGKSKSQSLTVIGTTPQPNPNTNTSGGGTKPNTNTATSGNTTSGGTKPETGNTTGSGSNTGTGNTTSSGNKPSTDSKEPKFTAVNETVYTTKKCNLRKSYSTESDKVAVVEKDTKLIRKAIGDNGWSKVEYEGKTVYVVSEYLTKEEPKEEVVFKDTHENLYAKQSCNLRASWSTDSEKVGYLEKGQPVERTGYADNGWSRILYEGKTVYVASRLLVVEKPEDDEDENTVANEVVNNSVENESIIDDPTQMSEEDRLKEIQEEVGVLPEVGTNAANIAYTIVTLIAVAGLVAGIIYIKKIK